MITYTEFILERIINESIFNYSDNFQKVLSRINLPIAKSLMSIKGKDINTSQNYIDLILAEDDMVTFISDAKSNEILGSEEILFRVIEDGRFLIKSPKNKFIFDKIGIDMDGDYFQEPSEDDVGKVLNEALGSHGTYVLFEYVESDDESKIGKKVVLNKECIVDNGPEVSKVWTTNRNKVKIGRFVRSVLKANNIDFLDKEIEMFVNAYKSEIELMNNAFMKFDVVEGDLISKFYFYTKYSILSGTLGNSCMKNKPKNYFDLYCKNPGKVRMAILYSDNGQIINSKYSSDFITGRALVWKTDQGDTIMDRIYTIHDKDVELFKKFAEKNNWWYKKIQNSDATFTAQRGEESKSGDYTISLSNVSFDYYPFVDTFAYLDKNGKVISNRSETPFIWSMGSTDGTLHQHRQN